MSPRRGYPFSNPLAAIEPTRPRAHAQRPMRLSGAVLFGVGALVTGASAVVDDAARNDVAGLAVTAGVMALVAVFLLLVRRVPDAVFLALPAVGTVLISLNLWFEPNTGGAIFYLWPMLWSAYFLRRREVAVHLVFLAVCYGIVAFEIATTTEPSTEWINTVAAVATATALVALLKDRLVAAVERLSLRARTDALTGVLNRGSLETELTRELSRAERSGAPLALLVADLDHFKGINDDHGHAAGDEALKHFCRIVERQKRGHDLLGRIGGEEFAVVLLDTDAAGGRRVAERIRTQVARSRIEPRFTVSIGVAERGQGPVATSQLLHAADTALYAAKAAGRDRVLVARPELAPVRVA